MTELISIKMQTHDTLLIFEAHRAILLLLPIELYLDNGAACTNRSGKEPYRQVGVGRVSIPRSAGGVMVSTRAWNARAAGSIPTLTLPIVVTPP